MDILAERIKEAREARHMTQTELAEKAGYTSRASINKIEKGLVDVPRSRVEAIAKVLRVSPAWLLGISDNSRDLIYIDPKMSPLIIEAQDADEAQIRLAAEYLAFLKLKAKEKK